MDNLIEENLMENKTQISQNEEILKQIESLKAQLPKKERKPKKLPVALTEEEFGLLLDNTKQKNHKVAFLLAFASGLRISEIVKLEQRHIDMKQRRILIELGKGSKDRIVPLAKGFNEVMYKMIPLKIGVRALEIAFKRACNRAKLLEVKPSLHFHSLRHGFATHSVKSGMNILTIRMLMGHSNISTTNVYLQANPEAAIKDYMEKF